MVIDTSALVAILQNEPERRTFNQLIDSAETCVISTANFVEVSIVVEARYGTDGVRDLDLFLSKAGIAQIPLDEEQAHLARLAFRRYGKGRHPAGLNFGDCFAYALAQSMGEPLLFKGDDFSGTDIARATV
jgi:ribonuclease VapC